MKKIILSGLMVTSIFFNGCAPRIVEGLKPHEMNQYAMKMYAPEEVVCNNAIVPKGTVFGVKDLKGQLHSSDGNDKPFPENSLFLSIVEDIYGFVVYPNGKFMYENYTTVMYMNGIVTSPWWLLLPEECKYSTETPFRVVE